MLDHQAVCARTEVGRNEIRRKSHGLTQSERLVLILMDGVANLSVIKSRLQGLTPERFNRAVDKLLATNMIEFVLLQVSSQQPEVIDDETADLFLRQDVLDPVTIISFEPEDDFSFSSSAQTDGSGPSTIIRLAPEYSSDTVQPLNVVEHGIGSALKSPGLIKEVSPALPTTIAAARAASNNKQPHRKSPQMRNRFGAASPSLDQSLPATSISDRSGNSTEWRYWLILLILSILTSVGILII